MQKKTYILFLRYYLQYLFFNDRFMSLSTIKSYVRSSYVSGINTLNKIAAGKYTNASPI